MLELHRKMFHILYHSLEIRHLLLRISKFFMIFTERS